MAHKLKNKPKYEQKVGNMKMQIFINKNKDGVKYAIYKIWRYRFPFKYNGSIDLYTSEFEKLRELLNKIPELQIKQTAKVIKMREKKLKDRAK